MAWLAAPAALTAWLVHPLITLRLLARRRRKRVDVSVHFWQVGLALGPVVLVAAAMSLLSDAPRWPLLFGWLVVFGWGGLVVHGMLTRILPFLFWFHWFAPRAGLAKVPPMRHLFPTNRARACLNLHIVAVTLGAAGFALQAPLLVRVGGAALAGAGVALAYAMVAMVRMRPTT